MIAILLIAAAAPSLPADIRQYLERRESCNHWAGEERYDADRKRQIARALSEGRCAQLAVDEDGLHRRYRDAPDMLAILDQANDTYGD